MYVSDVNVGGQTTPVQCAGERRYRARLRTAHDTM